MILSRCAGLAVGVCLLGSWGLAQPINGTQEPLPDGAVARIGSNRLRHLGTVRQVRFTPDQTHALSLGADGIFSAWDLETGTQTRRQPLPERFLRESSTQQERLQLIMLMRHGDALAVAGSTFSDDGKTLLFTTKGLVRFVDTLTGKETGRLELKDDKYGVIALSADRKLLARFTFANEREGEGELAIFDLPGGKMRQKLRLGQYDIMSRLTFSSDGKFLAGSSAHGHVILWDLAAGKRIRRFDADEPVSALAFVPGTHKLMSATHAWVYFWELASEEESAKLPLGEVHSCAAVFSPDGATLATSGKDNSIILWSVAAKQPRAQLTGHPSTVSALAFSPDGKKLVAGAVEGTVHVWDLASLREITPVAHRAKLSPVAYVDAKTLVARAGADGKLQRLDIPSGKVLKHLVPPSEEAGIWALVAPNAKVLACPNQENGAIQLWDPDRGQELHRFEGLTNRIAQLSFSADSSCLACLGNDRALRIWNTRTGKETHNLETPFGLDEGRVAFRGGPNFPANAFGRGGGQEERLSTPQVVVSDDNRYVYALGFTSMVVAWELATGKERERYALGNAGISQMILSPDGKWLATVSSGEIVRVWNTLGGKLVNGFFLDDSDVRSLAFSPSGRLLAVGTANGSVIVFDPALGKEKRRFIGHHGAVSKLLFAPAGKTLLSAGEEGILLFWDVDAPPAAKAALDAPNEAKLTQWWDRLGHPDPARALDAMIALKAHPRPAALFMAERLKPAPAVPPARVTSLLLDLHSGQFPVRERASTELLKFDAQILPALAAALKKDPPAEVARRIRDIVDKLDDRKTTPENLRLSRAVEILERIATPEAYALLETLATGAPAARLTSAAQDAVKRRQTP